jgi:glyoxylase-like metal-dependent hydrolase (beta-lactamase superfamily II)
MTLHLTRPFRRLAPIFMLMTLMLHPLPASAQRDWSKVEIKALEAGPGVYMLTGAGGNLGLCVGEDATFLVDDQYAPLTEKITAAVAKISEKPVRFVVNTHMHGDHAGGNENLGKAGALIVAHENVRRRMSVDQIHALSGDTTRAYPKPALPVITFTDSVSFHLNGQEITVAHVRNAHTDGDAVIHFRGSNVVHMGDVYFNGIYPFIDTGSGGSIRGMIAAVEAVLARVDESTKIIPGHGPLSNKREMEDYLKMLRGVRDGVRGAIAAGKTRDQTIAMKPTSSWDAIWGDGFMKPDLFTGSVYDDLSRDAR